VESPDTMVATSLSAAQEKIICLSYYEWQGWITEK
jgi:hypothetical protein